MDKEFKHLEEMTIYNSVLLLLLLLNTPNHKPIENQSIYCIHYFKLPIPTNVHTCTKVCYTHQIPRIFFGHSYYHLWEDCHLRVAETCERHTVCIIYFHKLICICWF
jgi:hypothetical protein